MWANFLQPIAFRERDLALLVDLSEGFSGSDIHETCVRLKRRQTTTRTEPHLSEAFQILRNLGIGNAEESRFLAC